MLSQVFNLWHIGIALFVNIVFEMVKPVVKKVVIPSINKVLPKGMDIETSKERTGFYWFCIWVLSVMVFYLMEKFDTVKLIENSLILSAIWLSVMSISLYTVGWQFLIQVFVKKWKNLQ
jgi:hypothetical protein